MYACARDAEQKPSAFLSVVCKCACENLVGMTETAQQPPLGGCPPVVAADDCIDLLDFRSCISWLDHSSGADHRSRAFQLTPSVALSLSLSLGYTWALHGELYQAQHCIALLGRQTLTGSRPGRVSPSREKHRPELVPHQLRSQGWGRAARKVSHRDCCSTKAPVACCSPDLRHAFWANQKYMRICCFLACSPLIHGDPPSRTANRRDVPSCSFAQSPL